MYDPLSPETRRTLAEGRETAGAMVRAARADLGTVVAVFLLGFLGAFYALRRYGWDYLRAATESGMTPALRERVEFVAQTPFDVVLLQTQLGVAVGVLVATPVFVYVSRSALEDRGLWPTLPDARWKLVPLAVASLSLFALGVAYSYALLFPLLFRFFAHNALNSGFLPTYSVAHWVHFLLVLTFVFGLAAQLPLAMSALVYAGVVPYSVLRERWRHAVAVIVLVSSSVNGSPDPVSMLIVAVPLIALYGVGLAFAGAATVVDRGDYRFGFRAAVRAHRVRVAVACVAAGTGTYLILGPLGSRLPDSASPPLADALRALSLPRPLAVALACVAAGGIAGLVALLWLEYAGLDASDGADTHAPAMSGPSVDGDRGEKRVRRPADGVEGDDGDDPADRLARAATALREAFADAGSDSDGSGGHVRDVAAVLEALSTRTLRIVGAFGTTTVLAFSWLSTGGTGTARRDFLGRLPPQVPSDALGVVTLHPAEALVFETKLAAFAGALATAPLVAYYAWPALRDRGVVRGRREFVLGWTAALGAGFVGGSAVGYARVAPAVTAYLVADAVRADMILSYRITAFFWVVFVASVGVGALTVVPLVVVSLNHGGVPYRTMRSRWREVSVGVLAFAAVFTPASVPMALLVTVPFTCAYWAGLVVLSVLTRRGRRDLYTYRGGA